MAASSPDASGTDSPHSFSPPLVVPPLSAPHSSTLILLHGRGDVASDFGPQLLSTPVPVASGLKKDRTTLRALLPHTRFVFPTAQMTPSSNMPGVLRSQWFDGVSPPGQAEDNPDPNLRERWRGWQRQGLRNVCGFVAKLVEEEVEALKDRGGKVILGGLSQGCASSLVAFLAGASRTEGLGGFVGMCGWLPFEGAVREALSTQSPVDGPGADMVKKDSRMIAVNELRAQLGFSPLPLLAPRESPANIPPVWLSHGCVDQVVGIELGRGARDCLMKMDIDVRWTEHPTLAHWYSPRMLTGLADFVKERMTHVPEGRMNPVTVENDNSLMDLRE